MEPTSFGSAGVSRTALRLLALVLLLGVVSAAGCGTAGESRTGIAGSVRDWGPFGGTVPLAGNRVVCLDATTHALVKATRSDRLGRYFLAVPPGRYKVAYSSGSKPAPVDATVVAGEVTTLDPFVGTRGGGILPQGARQRLLETVQPLALALGVERRKTTMLHVTGSTAGAAAAVFGVASGLPADEHVWVCIVSGDVEGWSSAAAARDLARGGFVAYELRASTLELLSSRSSSRPWKLPDATDPEDWGGTNGFSLF